MYRLYSPFAENASPRRKIVLVETVSTPGQRRAGHLEQALAFDRRILTSLGYKIVAELTYTGPRYTHYFGSCLIQPLRDAFRYADKLNADVVTSRWNRYMRTDANGFNEEPAPWEYRAFQRHIIGNSRAVPWSILYYGATPEKVKSFEARLSPNNGRPRKSLPGKRKRRQAHCLPLIDEMLGPDNSPPPGIFTRWIAKQLRVRYGIPVCLRTVQLWVQKVQRERGDYFLRDKENAELRKPQ